MQTLKLNKLEKKQLQNVRGGLNGTVWYSGTYVNGQLTEIKCTCGCYYANSGGSSINDNYNANDKGGLTTRKF